MRITIGYCTGNRFEDGTPEYGQIFERTVHSFDEMQEIIDSIPDGQNYDIWDVNGHYNDDFWEMMYERSFGIC